MSCLLVDTIRPNHNCAVKICCLVSETGTSADYQGTTATFNTATITNVNVVTGTIDTIQSARGDFGTVAVGHSVIGSLIATFGTIPNLNVINYTVDTLFVENGTITTLDVGSGSLPPVGVTDCTIGTLYATIGTIGTLDVADGTIGTLYVTDGTIGTLKVDLGTISNLNVEDGTIGSLNATFGTIPTLYVGNCTIGTFRANDATFGELGIVSGDQAIVGGLSMPVIFPDGGDMQDLPFKIESNRQGAALTNNAYWNHLYNTCNRYDESYGALSLLMGRPNVHIFGCYGTDVQMDNFATFTPEHLTLWAPGGKYTHLAIGTDNSLSVSNNGIMLDYGLTRGGDASPLNHYEEYNHVSVVTGPWSSGSDPEMKLIRRGKNVTMSWGNNLRRWETGGMTAYVTLSTALPERFWPAVPLVRFRHLCTDMNVEYTGSLTVDGTNGHVRWYLNWDNMFTTDIEDNLSGPYAGEVTWIAA